MKAVVRLAVDRGLRAGTYTASCVIMSIAGRFWHLRAAPERFVHIKMILTQCAVCATELGLTLSEMRPLQYTLLGPNAGCSTGRRRPRPALQKIKKQAAPSDNANNKYAEAKRGISVSAGGAKGQTCTSARGPSIGDQGRPRAWFRAVDGGAAPSCLVEQAKILTRGEANNLGLEALDERWAVA